MSRMGLSPQLTKRALISKLTTALAAFRRLADDSTGPDMDVRVVVDIADETWWLATGDVQYDTVHGDLCAAGQLWVSMTTVEVAEVAEELIAALRASREVVL